MTVSGIGRVVADAEIKNSNGKEFITFRFACNDAQKNGMFFDCVTWQKSIAQYLLKGKQIYISGTLGVHKWTATDGTERERQRITVNELLLCSDREAQSAPAQTQTAQVVQAQRVPAQNPDEFNDSEVPF